MRFEPTPLDGAYLVLLEPHADERGFFARSFCEQEFAAHGLVNRFVQDNIAFNRRRHTLRGLHYQADPHAEVKTVRCTRGAIHDVIVDIRPASPTFAHWAAFELSADNRHMLYVPAGFAHGYQTLTDDAEVHYQMAAVYRAEAARGIRWDDPRLAIDWPDAERFVSERDRALPCLGEAE